MPLPASVDVRLSGIKDAIQRARLSFLATTVASVVLLASVWNGYGSWHRHMVRDELLPETTAAGILQREAFRAWVRSQWVNVGPLGLQIGVSDAVVVGTVALCVLGSWMFWSVRRQNHAVADLLGDAIVDTSLHTKDIQLAIFYGIQDQMVFAVLTDEDEPVTSLAARRTAAIGEQPMFSMITPAPVLRWVLRRLLYLPVIAIACVVVADIGSLTWSDALFRGPDTHGLFGRISTAALTQAVLMEIFGIFGAFFLIGVIRRVDRFETATIGLLREFARFAKEIPDPALAIGGPRRPFIEILRDLLGTPQEQQARR